jgi:hypothetical protein
MRKVVLHYSDFWSRAKLATRASMGAILTFPKKIHLETGLVGTRTVRTRLF